MAGSNPTGKAILKASLELFRQDRQMIWLPVMAAATAFVTFAVITVPVAVVAEHSGIAVFIALAVATVVATSATLIFNVALCFAAADRIEGRGEQVRPLQDPQNLAGQTRQDARAQQHRRGPMFDLWPTTGGFVQGTKGKAAAG